MKIVARPPTLAELPEVLRAEDVARFLRVGVRSVRRMAEQGEIPCVRVGRFLRFSRAQFVAWWEGQAEADREAA